ncbi:RNA polymerase sigma factor [Lacinutrix iliipiscaria]|uniref:RNA polymerase sigma factor n=1 Tax=Lacinutrix iliipiscaria TaxID=1230532 RepID=A0ABW5WR05_9FLAO
MKTNKQIDAALVEAYQLGDKAALAKLVKRWHLLFCKKAHWLLKDADASKDIAQESWTTIMAKMETLKDTSKFGSWALRIVYSKALDALRKMNKERINQQDYAKDQVVFVEDDKENLQLKNALLKAIRSLPSQQQLVIKLFYVEDYSLKEISKTLNISVGTVKSRLFHAREILKRTLKHTHYENV